MARTRTARGVDDPEALYEHYREAGNREQASAQAAVAAEKAEASLAFDRVESHARSQPTSGSTPAAAGGTGGWPSSAQHVPKP